MGILTCRVSSTSIEYKVSTKTVQINKHGTLNKKKNNRAAVRKELYNLITETKTINSEKHR